MKRIDRLHRRSRFQARRPGECYTRASVYTGDLVPWQSLRVAIKKRCPRAERKRVGHAFAQGTFEPVCAGSPVNSDKDRNRAPCVKRGINFRFAQHQRRFYCLPGSCARAASCGWRVRTGAGIRATDRSRARARMHAPIARVQPERGCALPRMPVTIRMKMELDDLVQTKFVSIDSIKKKRH